MTTHRLMDQHSSYQHRCRLILPQWIGTKFVFGGNSRTGCDCAGLVIGVYQELHIQPQHTNLLAFRQQLHCTNLRQASQMISQYLPRYFCKVSQGTDGDLALFNFQHTLLHMGFIVDDSIIHARLDCHQVIRQHWDAELKQAFQGFYQLQEFYYPKNTSTYSQDN